MNSKAKASRSRELATKVLDHVMTVLAESDGKVEKSEIHRRLEADLDFEEWERSPSGKQGTFRCP